MGIRNLMGQFSAVKFRFDGGVIPSYWLSVIRPALMNHRGANSNLEELKILRREWKNGLRGNERERERKSNKKRGKRKIF